MINSDVFNGLVKYSSQSLVLKLKYYSHYDCDIVLQHPEHVHPINTKMLFKPQNFAI